MEILALFGWGAKVDYVNDPRLDEISYTQLKRWMLKQDGAIKRGIAGAAAEGGSAARVSLCGRLVGGLFVVELEKEMIDGIGSSRTA